MITIPELGDHHHAMWTELIRLSHASPARWTLIGAQMVALHGWGVGRDVIRPSMDADVLVDARVVTDGVARTVRVAGGTQALRRSSPVEAQTRGVTGAVPVPNLLGAILVKARAIDVDDVPDAQRADVAFLLSLVKDPEPLLHDITRAERGWLRHHTDTLGDLANPCWREIDNAEDGLLVFRRLAG